MDLNIPKKDRTKFNETTYNHQARLNEDKTVKFARVREILGGYSNQEILEILIDKAIETYYDGEDVNLQYLPKELRTKIKEE